MGSGVALSFTYCDKVLLCNLGWSQTPRDLPASVTRMLELKACTTTPGS